MKSPMAGYLPQPKDEKAGRGWHHHSRAPRRRSMGQGGRPAVGITRKPQKSFPVLKIFCTRLSDGWILNLQGSPAFK
jgi:hypothetical protein